MTPDERLIRLAEVLEARPEYDAQFDMTKYAESSFCQTVACAVGWGAFDPILQSEGLSMGVYRLGWRTPDNIFRPEEVLSGNGHAPTFHEHVGATAVDAFFELDSKKDFDYLFTSGSYPSSACGPHDVADRIRRFVARRSRT